jgi:diguanylate cyclase (GGDEF)-like protein/PAS domain S-box-containing protein
MIFRRILLWGGLFLLAFPPSGWCGDFKVFILHSYHSGFAWTEKQHQGFIDTLGKSPVIDSLTSHTEYLDAKRLTLSPGYLAATRDFFQRKYSSFSPDLIYATDDDALSFLQTFKSRIFPDTPVVFSGINDLARDAQLNHDQYLGFFELKDIVGTVALALKLEPGLTDLYFVGDGTASFSAIRESARRDMAKNFPRIQTSFIADRRLSRVTARLTKLGRGNLVLCCVGGLQDDQGRLVPTAAAVAAMAGAGDFRIFATADVQMVDGVLGGSVNQGRKQGVGAGLLAREWQLREAFDEQDAAQTDQTSSYLFDEHQLRRFAISPGDLPADSHIVHQPMTLWLRLQHFRWPIIGLCGVQFALLWLLWRNILSRRRGCEDLEKSERQFKTVVEATHDAVVMIDDQGLVTLFNPAAEHLFGWTGQEMLGNHLDVLMPEGYRQQHRQDMASFFSTGEPREAVGRSLELLAIHRSGREFPVAISLSLGRYNNQHFVLALLRDISGQRQVERELRQLAYYDTLTGLPNRALFEDRFQRVLHTAERTQRMAALLFVGVDNLKAINDTRGHACGDQLLKRIGQKLKKIVRQGVTVVRWEGDKFVVLLPGLQGIQEVEEAAQTVVRTFAEPFEMQGQHFFVTASVGVAVYPKDGVVGEKLLKHADMAMYAAKERGRNTYCFFTEEMNRRVVERGELEHNLRQALAREEFFLAYQPQVDIRTGQMVGAEALLRWRHPEQGLISPGRFIPLAEDNGQILPIGQWVLHAACVQNRAWQQAGYPPMRVAVNLSARQFQQPDFYDQVAGVLKDTGLDPGCLELELTESALMADAEAAVEILRALRELGVCIAIDDFGTGYSSLSYLKTFPIDRLKIAQDFVLDITNSSDDAAIVETVIAMAHGLGLRVVAEGVETVEQMLFLKARNCPVMQGYYFARPMPPEDFIEYLADTSLGNQAEGVKNQP